jgi:hypothetical protein
MLAPCVRLPLLSLFLWKHEQIKGEIDFWTMFTAAIHDHKSLQTWSCCRGELFSCKYEKIIGSLPSTWLRQQKHIAAPQQHQWTPKQGSQLTMTPSKWHLRVHYSTNQMYLQFRVNLVTKTRKQTSHKYSGSTEEQTKTYIWTMIAEVEWRKLVSTQQHL